MSDKPKTTRTMQLWLDLCAGHITEEEFREMLIARTKEHQIEIGFDGRHATKGKKKQKRSSARVGRIRQPPTRPELRQKQNAGIWHCTRRRP